MNSGLITAVKQDGKNKHRFHIFIEEEFAFSVHEDILVRFHLRKGKEIDGAAYVEIVEEEERNQAYLLAIRFLGYRPRTAAQLERYLLDKGHDEQTARQVRYRCEQQGYVNDESFARQWVQERIKGKSRSSLALRRELQMKGIDRDIIEGAIRSISQEDELQAARRWASKRLKGDVAPIDANAERKLLMALARNGFSTSILQQLRREWRTKGRDEEE